MQGANMQNWIFGRNEYFLPNSNRPNDRTDQNDSYTHTLNDSASSLMQFCGSIRAALFTE